MQPMHCPRCVETKLLASDRQGIEIDRCPQCRGVWLDRGELDKLIELSLAAVPALGQPNTAASQAGAADAGPDRERDPGRRPPNPRRDTWLSHIFD
jgi:uncharacterized protein